MDDHLKKIIINPEILQPINQKMAELRIKQARELQEAEQKRFQEIADKIIQLLKKEIK